jgi:transposase
MIVKNYIGCDISKERLDLFNPLSGGFRHISNQAAAISAFVAALDPGRDFVVLEATGIHDRILCHQLAAGGIAFSRRNPVQTRRFAQAGKLLAKTDRVDARMLSDYGRRLTPQPDPRPCAERQRIAALSRRRDQLVEARAREKKHIEEAFEVEVVADIKATIAHLDARIKGIEAALTTALKQADPATAVNYDILLSAPGVGPVTALALIAHMPELGARSPKTIACLAGLAPLNNDSGKRNGKKAIRGGRARVRRALYMAALGAIRKSPGFRAFFEAVAARSASKKLAIIAVARKLLTALNAMIRDQKPYA